MTDTEKQSSYSLSAYSLTDGNTVAGRLADDELRGQSIILSDFAVMDTRGAVNLLEKVRLAYQTALRNKEVSEGSVMVESGNVTLHMPNFANVRENNAVVMRENR